MINGKGADSNVRIYVVWSKMGKAYKVSTSVKL